jgi:hypothetical protein
MSLSYSDTTNQDGIIQVIETEIYGADGLTRISGNTTQLAIWTGRVNRALDRALAIIFEADGRNQFDDSNHTDHPIVYFDLVDGQRDYTFTQDEQSNLILGIHKIAILSSATDTEYKEIRPVDQQNTGEGYDLVANNTTEGVPYQYDKTGSGIFLDPIPSYNATNGLKVYIDREASYFATSDTTKTPGIDGRLHEYLALKPALDYALSNNLANAAGIQLRVVALEEEMKVIYGNKFQDEQQNITSANIDPR